MTVAEHNTEPTATDTDAGTGTQELLAKAQELLADVVELQGLRDKAHWKAQELRTKYDLRLPGDPYPELDEGFVEEVLRVLQRLRIDPFTNKVVK